MKKITKILNLLTSFLLISAFLICTSLGAFFITSIKSISIKEVDNIIYPKYSIITDENSRVIEDFKENSVSYISYEDIPKILVDALISIEDRDFYKHNGINEKRILSSLFSNLNKNNGIQGGSTLTQQLVKNILLSNEKTYKRKVQEAYLSLLLEKELSKEEILELYFNRIYFDQSIPGIQYASNKFFNKDVRYITLPEAALLVGLVKSPSIYYPITNQDKADKRKNEVLNAMLSNNKITLNQYNIASSYKVQDLLKLEQSTQNYDYQAYLDVVYKEVKNLTGYDVFSYPLKVETYIDTYLQGYIDDIQEGKILSFSNDEQQIGGVVLDKNSHIIGIVGGRNYQGKKLYNHAFDMKTNPASTIKPVFSYALAVEHLHYNTLTTIEDKEYFYPNSSTSVHNADKRYLGNLTLLEAIGYSRNTCAVATLEKVAKKIGLDEVKSYLTSINLMDQGPFSYSYALGGMSYGVSPTNIAGAYSMLLNNGQYKTPTTIKRITDLETNEVIYQNSSEPIQVISEESSDIITNTLQRVVDSNFLSMNIAKPNNITIAGKTGTGAYSKQIINKYNLPSNADKDIWFSGYSPNYTCTIWSGFDEVKENKKTYFSGKEGKNIPKQLFNLLISKMENKSSSFEISKNLTKVYVVTHLDKEYIPNDLVPSKYINYAYYKKEDIPKEVSPYPTLSSIDSINTILCENTACFSILNHNIVNDLYSTFYGDKGYLFNIYLDSKLIDSLFTTEPYLEVELVEKGIYEVDVLITYQNNHNIKGDPYRITYSVL